MSAGSTIDTDDPGSETPEQGGRRPTDWAAVVLGLALLSNAAWLFLLLWFVVRSGRLLFAEL
jgi:hypothetical protein